VGRDLRTMLFGIALGANFCGSSGRHHRDGVHTFGSWNDTDGRQVTTTSHIAGMLWARAGSRGRCNTRALLVDRGASS
jgi:hypothetical protein